MAGVRNARLENVGPSSQNARLENTETACVIWIAKQRNRV